MLLMKGASAVRFSTHYYVLSLSTMSSALFEAFRDSLIDVENQGFPVSGPVCEPGATGHERRRDLSRTVDEYFGRYYAQEPLGLVVVGAPEMQVAFSSVTVHGPAVIGRIEGDHVWTSARDLGQIVWPVVKVAISGWVARALRDLEACTEHGRVATGLEAVARAADQGAQATLLVEDDYRLRGSVQNTNGSPVVTSRVDIRDSIDDAVDAVIEKVLGFAGNVVFMPPGTLRVQEKIVLLQSGAGDP
jgi:hypothetical protein